MIIFLLVFAFNIASAFSQTAVTLFEFGTNRLESGSSTRPLSPLGTASGNSETTYLYEVVDPVTNTNGAVALTTVSRTIVASASGWAEPLGTATIECKFIDSTDGICFGAITGTATGTPSPVVLKVTRTTTTPATSTTATPATSTTTTSATSTTTITEFQPNPSISPTASAFQNSRKSPAGAIAGGTVAGVACVTIVVIFILWRGRKRSRRPKLIVEQSNTYPEETIHRNAGYSRPFVRSIQTTGSDSDSISSQTENGYSLQPQSKRQMRMTDVIDQLIKRRLGELGLVSNPPPSYAN